MSTGSQGKIGHLTFTLDMNQKMKFLFAADLQVHSKQQQKIPINEVQEVKGNGGGPCRSLGLTRIKNYSS